jgi:hydroxyacylglutathione hydrolase
MYDSLHQRLMRLDDAVEVYPAHGAGSMCGRNLSQETTSTIGAQRQFNYALKPMSKAEFVSMMTTDLPEAPAYFERDAEINRGGAVPLETLPRPRALSPRAIFDLASQAHVILDVRSAADFGAGHLPGSINIGLSGQFAMWAGSLIPLTAPIVIVAESEERVDEATIRLARVGMENVKGYLDGGILAWAKSDLAVLSVPQITVDQLRELASESESDLQIMDVRRPAEYESGHVPGAIAAPLSSLRDVAPALGLSPTKTTAVICASGYRSSVATSILQQFGFTDLLNINGGTNAWIAAGYAVSKESA